MASYWWPLGGLTVPAEPKGSAPAGAPTAAESGPPKAPSGRTSVAAAHNSSVTAASAADARHLARAAFHTSLEGLLVESTKHRGLAVLRDAVLDTRQRQYDPASLFETLCIACTLLAERSSGGTAVTARRHSSNAAHPKTSSPAARGSMSRSSSGAALYTMGSGNEPPHVPVIATEAATLLAAGAHASSAASPPHPLHYRHNAASRELLLQSIGDIGKLIALALLPVTQQVGRRVADLVRALAFQPSPTPSVQPSSLGVQLPARAALPPPTWTTSASVAPSSAPQSHSTAPRDKDPSSGLLDANCGGGAMSSAAVTATVSAAGPVHLVHDDPVLVRLLQMTASAASRCPLGSSALAELYGVLLLFYSGVAPQSMLEATCEATLTHHIHAVLAALHDSGAGDDGVVSASAHASDDGLVHRNSSSVTLTASTFAAQLQGVAFIKDVCRLMVGARTRWLHLSPYSTSTPAPGGAAGGEGATAVSGSNHSNKRGAAEHHRGSTPSSMAGITASVAAAAADASRQRDQEQQQLSLSTSLMSKSMLGSLAAFDDYAGRLRLFLMRASPLYAQCLNDCVFSVALWGLHEMGIAVSMQPPPALFVEVQEQQQRDGPFSAPPCSLEVFMCTQQLVLVPISTHLHSMTNSTQVLLEAHDRLLQRLCRRRKPCATSSSQWLCSSGEASGGSLMSSNDAERLSQAATVVLSLWRKTLTSATLLWELLQLRSMQGGHNAEEVAAGMSVDTEAYRSSGWYSNEEWRASSDVKRNGYNSDSSGTAAPSQRWSQSAHDSSLYPQRPSLALSRSRDNLTSSQSALDGRNDSEKDRASTPPVPGLGNAAAAGEEGGTGVDATTVPLLVRLVLSVLALVVSHMQLHANNIMQASADDKSTDDRRGGGDGEEAEGAAFTGPLLRPSTPPRFLSAGDSEDDICFTEVLNGLTAFGQLFSQLVDTQLMPSVAAADKEQVLCRCRECFLVLHPHLLHCEQLCLRHLRYEEDVLPVVLKATSYWVQVSCVLQLPEQRDAHLAALVDVLRTQDPVDGHLVALAPPTALGMSDTASPTTAMLLEALLTLNSACAAAEPIVPGSVAAAALSPSGDRDAASPGSGGGVRGIRQYALSMSSWGAEWLRRRGLTTSSSARGNTASPAHAGGGGSGSWTHAVILGVCRLQHKLFIMKTLHVIANTLGAQLKSGWALLARGLAVTEPLLHMLKRLLSWIEESAEEQEQQEQLLSDALHLRDALRSLCLHNACQLPYSQFEIFFTELVSATVALGAAAPSQQQDGAALAFNHWGCGDLHAAACAAASDRLPRHHPQGCGGQWVLTSECLSVSLLAMLPFIELRYTDATNGVATGKVGDGSGGGDQPGVQVVQLQHQRTGALARALYLWELEARVCRYVTDHQHVEEWGRALLTTMKTHKRALLATTASSSVEPAATDPDTPLGTGSLSQEETRTIELVLSTVVGHVSTVAVQMCRSSSRRRVAAVTSAGGEGGSPLNDTGSAAPSPSYQAVQSAALTLTSGPFAAVPLTQVANALFAASAASGSSLGTSGAKDTLAGVGSGGRLPLLPFVQADAAQSIARLHAAVHRSSQAIALHTPADDSRSSVATAPPVATASVHLAPLEQLLASPFALLDRVYGEWQLQCAGSPSRGGGQGRRSAAANAAEQHELEGRMSSTPLDTNEARELPQRGERSASSEALEASAAFSVVAGAVPQLLGNAAAAVLMDVVKIVQSYGEEIDGAAWEAILSLLQRTAMAAKEHDNTLAGMSVGAAGGSGSHTQSSVSMDSIGGRSASSTGLLGKPGIKAPTSAAGATVSSSQAVESLNTAFRALESIQHNHIPRLNVDGLHRLIVCVGTFTVHRVDGGAAVERKLHTNLSAVQLLWSIADYLAAFGSGADEEIERGGACNNANGGSSGTVKATAAGCAGAAAGGMRGSPTRCSDDALEVRQSALQTFFALVQTYGWRFSAACWRCVLQDVLLPLMEIVAVATGLCATPPPSPPELGEDGATAATGAAGERGAQDATRQRLLRSFMDHPPQLEEVRAALFDAGSRLFVTHYARMQAAATALSSPSSARSRRPQLPVTEEDKDDATQVLERFLRLCGDVCVVLRGTSGEQAAVAAVHALHGLLVEMPGKGLHAHGIHLAWSALEQLRHSDPSSPAPYFTRLLFLLQAVTRCPAVVNSYYFPSKAQATLLEGLAAVWPTLSSREARTMWGEVLLPAFPPAARLQSFVLQDSHESVSITVVDDATANAAATAAASTRIPLKSVMPPGSHPGYLGAVMETMRGLMLRHMGADAVGATAARRRGPDGLPPDPASANTSAAATEAPAKTTDEDRARLAFMAPSTVQVSGTLLLLHLAPAAVLEVPPRSGSVPFNPPALFLQECVNVLQYTLWEPVLARTRTPPTSAAAVQCRRDGVVALCRVFELLLTTTSTVVRHLHATATSGAAAASGTTTVPTTTITPPHVTAALQSLDLLVGTLGEVVHFVMERYEDVVCATAAVTTLTIASTAEGTALARVARRSLSLLQRWACAISGTPSARLAPPSCAATPHHHQRTRSGSDGSCIMSPSAQGAVARHDVCAQSQPADHATAPTAASRSKLQDVVRASIESRNKAIMAQFVGNPDDASAGALLVDTLRDMLHVAQSSARADPRAGSDAATQNLNTMMPDLLRLVACSSREPHRSAAAISREQEMRELLANLLTLAVDKQHKQLACQAESRGWSGCRADDYRLNSDAEDQDEGTSII
ncbi:hypothetical protein CGC21_18315 [Leishmania donovani]|uniref:Mon2 C-terminal domain-containing protein n=1 Tax=Leishmania donovani TaxID=5661 RepID=A0A504WYW5_LEIDO|nr:hypothetical protein CGC21_18315 [Leishmania donovani]